MVTAWQIQPFIPVSISNNKNSQLISKVDGVGPVDNKPYGKNLTF